MGRASNRKRQAQSLQPGAVHALSQIEVQQLRKGPAIGMLDAEKNPALAALLNAAELAVTKTIPQQFEVDGRTYYLRCSIGLARYEVFDSAAKASPLIAGYAGSFDSFGHTPGH